MATKCRNCNGTFTLKAEGRTRAKLPMVLECGHYYCKQCIAQLKRYHTTQLPCPECRKPTSLEKDLPLCFHAVGILSARQLGLRGLSFSHPEERQHVLPNLDDYVPAPAHSKKCEECAGKDGDVVCDRCHSVFCDACFQSVHSTSKTLRLHTALPLSLVPLQLECPSHRGQECNRYCTTCDVPVCTVCLDDGEERKHSAHQTVTLRKATEHVQNRLSQPLQDARNFLKSARETHQQLHEQSQLLSGYTQSKAELIEGIFSSLHSCLQASEAALLEELEATCRARLRQFDLKFEEVAVAFEKVGRAMKDLSALRQDPGKLLTRHHQVLSQLERSMKNASLCSAKGILQLPKYSYDWNKFSSCAKEIVSLCWEDVPMIEEEAKSSQEEMDSKSRKRTSSESSGKSALPSSQLSMQHSHSPRKLSPSDYSSQGSSWQPSPVCWLPSSAASHTQSSQGSSAHHSEEDIDDGWGSALDMTVTHVISPSEFWVQYLKDLPAIEKLNRRLAKRCRNNVTEAPLNIGALCVAVHGDKWLRARVESVQWLASTYISVFFIDYGDTEMVTLDGTAALPPNLAKPPPFAHKCCLGGVKPVTRYQHLAPSDWSQHVVSFFRSLTLHQTKLRVKVLSVDRDGTNTVKLYIPVANGGQSIADVLVNQGKAERKVTRNKRKKAPSQFLPPVVVPPLGETVRIYLITATSPHHVFVHLASSTENEERILSLLQPLAEHQLPVEDPTPGTLCSTRYSDRQYYRARVVGHHDDMVKVIFVDYGNLWLVEPEALLKLNDKTLLSLPPLALQCTVPDVSWLDDQEGWSKEACEWFYSVGSSSELSLTVLGEGDPVPVRLVDIRTNQSLSDLLVAEGLGRYVEFRGAISSNLSPTAPTMSSATKDTAASSSVPSSWITGSKIAVPAPTIASSPDSTPPNSPSIVTPPPSHCLSSLLHNRDSATSLPVHPLEAVMSSSEPATPLHNGSTSPVVGFPEPPVVAPPQSPRPSPDSSVAHQEVPKEPVPPLLSPPPASIPAVGFSGMTTVTSVDSPSSFHVVLSQETSHNLQCLITKAVTLLVPDGGFCPTRGTYCLAPFLGSYYRAEVMEVVDGGCQVLFVDFGNREAVQDRLLPLPAELRSIPVQALLCRLDGVAPLSSGEAEWSYQSSYAFANLVIEKEVEMTVQDVASDRGLLVSLKLHPEGDLGSWLVEHNYALFSPVGCHSPPLPPPKSSLTTNQSSPSTSCCVLPPIQHASSDNSLGVLPVNESATLLENDLSLRFHSPAVMEELENSQSNDGAACEAVAGAAMKDDPGISSSALSSQATVDGPATDSDSLELSDSYRPPRWPTVSPVKVLVSHVDEKGVVSACPLTSAVLQRQVYDEMQEVGRSGCGAVASLDGLFPGQACCARYTEDGAWYRAVIQQLDRDRETVKVLYIDYGNSEELSVESQSLIVQQPLKHIPQLSLRFRLSGQTSEVYGTKLSQLLLDKEISIIISDTARTHSYPIVQVVDEGLLAKIIALSPLPSSSSETD